jgi:TPR repeat protein
VRSEPEVDDEEWTAALRGDAKAQKAICGQWSDLQRAAGTDSGGIDHARAFQWASTAAAREEPDGLYLMGRFYEMGIGTAADRKSALSHYERAVRAGHLHAATRLAPFLIFGVETKVDVPRALELLRPVRCRTPIQIPGCAADVTVDTSCVQAREAKNGCAHLLLGLIALYSLDHRNWEEAAQHLRTAHTDADGRAAGDAAFHLAIAHERGCGVAVDLKAAEPLYLQAAKSMAGHWTHLCACLPHRSVAEGVCHERGYGSDDPSRTAPLRRPSARRATARRPLRAPSSDHTRTERRTRHTAPAPWRGVVISGFGSYQCV